MIKVTVQGISIHSRLADFLDSLDINGNGEVEAENDEDVKILISRFLEQKQGSLTVSFG